MSRAYLRLLRASISITSYACDFSATDESLCLAVIYLSRLPYGRSWRHVDAKVKAELRLRMYVTSIRYAHSSAPRALCDALWCPSFFDDIAKTKSSRGRALKRPHHIWPIQFGYPLPDCAAMESTPSLARSSEVRAKEKALQGSKARAS